MNYIDVKIMVTKRLLYADSTNMVELVKEIQTHGIDEVLDDAKGFVECEVRWETEQQIEPQGNYGDATITVYKNNTLIWQNDERHYK